MPLITKHDFNLIFASQAPSIDQPPIFKNYSGGWGVESRPNNGKPTIKGFNKLQQVTDEKLLWIHQNGAALPFDENMEYAENAPVMRDGVLVQKKGDEWKPVGVNKASDILDESGLTQQEWNNGVESIADLLAIPNPKNGNRVYVKSIQKWYTYDINLTTLDNGVTIVGKWEMDVQEAYYASLFATPEQNTDESVKLRTGYAYATSKKRPFIIDGHYYVDSSINSGDPNGNPTALKTLSNSVLWFLENGRLEHLPTDKPSYNIIHTMDVENYVIHRPVLVGERDSHIGTTGEWGYLLTIYQSKNGYVFQPNCSNAWGDGIYIGKAAGTASYDVPENITIFEPIINNSRRNGISFTAGNNVNIVRPIISNTNGIAPEAGIDVEPEEVGIGADYPATITNSTISDPIFINNKRNIWISWYNKDRHIDLNFTGITKIIGGDYPFTFYSSSAELSDKQTGVVNFQCIDFTCTNESKKFNTELSLEDRGAIVNIEKLIIRNAERWTTHFVRFGTQDIAIAGLKVHNIQSETLNYVTFATTSVNGDKQTINPKLTLGFDPSVFVLTDPDNGNQIKYGLSKIGGYSLRDSTSSASSYNYPSNNIIVKPFPDAYVSLSGDYRKLKISIDARDESIDRTLYINDVTVELINGTVKGGITLQGKGGFVEVQKYPTGRGVIYNAYGNVS